MRQQLFEESHRREWARFEAQLAELEGGRAQASQPAAPLAEFPGAYRRLCHHLSLARERNYGSQLVDYLDRLVLRGHQQLYRRKPDLPGNVIAFAVSGFPSLVRREWRLCLAAAALFYLPGLLLGLLVWLHPGLVYSAMPTPFVEQIEAMYDPAAEHIGRVRGAASDFAMFGHYIQNNISISFRTFAGGILFGLGSIFFIAYNGLLLGAISGHIVNIGYQETFFPFVVGHGAFELTAIILSGAAGLRLGLALLAPGRKRRLEALRDAAGVAIKIMYGVIAMLLIAAFVEAFWSSSAVLANEVKYGVGALCWLAVALYFLRMGRIDAARPH